jgi:peptidoglycan/LPS O-acetylase OafA/YrhL
MSDADEILRRLTVEREHDEAEARRWEVYRKLCGPPRWFMLLLVALGLGTVALVFLTLEMQKDRAVLVGIGRIGLAIYALVWPLLLIYVETRRRRGLKRILEQEATALAAKLREERIL